MNITGQIIEIDVDVYMHSLVTSFDVCDGEACNDNECDEDYLHNDYWLVGD